MKFRMAGQSQIIKRPLNQDNLDSSLPPSLFFSTESPSLLFFSTETDFQEPTKLRSKSAESLDVTKKI